MVVRNVSATGVRIVIFAVFLVLLTVFPRFCTRVPENEQDFVKKGTPPPTNGPEADGMFQQATPRAVPTSVKKKFTHIDRRKVQEEAMMLEWDICQEQKPSADECRLTGVVVTPTNDGRAVAEIYVEYWYSNWESDRPKRLSVKRYYERWADGWVLTQLD